MTISSQAQLTFFLRKHGHLIILGVFFLACFGIGVAEYPLFDLDEGAFSQATLEMIYRSNYLATYLNDVPRYDKPIFAYWGQLLFIKLFGVNELGFRMVSILSAGGWAIAIFWIVSKIYDASKAFWATIAFMTSLIVLIVGKAATADSLLNLFLVLTQFFIYLFITRNEKHYLVLASVAAGFGFMTKGPVAALIPGLTVFAYCVAERSFSSLGRVFLSWRAWVVFLVIALPWYVWITYVEGPGFLRGFIFEHNIGRFSNSMESHDGPIYYYLIVLPLMVLPHLFFLPNAVLNVVSLWRKDSFIRFLTFWFLSVFVVFSLSATKLPHYLLYGLTPIFIFIGIAIHEKQNNPFSILPSILTFVICFFLPEIFSSISSVTNDPYVRDMLVEPVTTRTWKYSIFAGLIILIIMMVLPCRKFLIELNPYISLRYLIASFAFVILVNFGLIKVIASIQQEPIREAAQIARGINKTVVIWRQRTPSFSVYYGKVVRTDDPEAGQLFLTKSKHLSSIASYKIIYEKRGLVLCEKL